MSDSRDPTSSVTAAASRPLPEILFELSSSSQALPILGALWIGVLWLTTQVPQLHAAGLGTDGLPRGELLALHALGLTNLAWSLAVWLLAGLTAFAVVAALLTGRARWQLRDGVVALAFVVLAGSWLWVTQSSPPVVLDIPVGDKQAQVAAWTLDGGGLAPAPGRWEGACLAQPGSVALKCTVVGAGLRHEVALSPGDSAASHGAQLTWLASAPAPMPGPMTLNWRAKPDGRDQFALNLQAGEGVAAPLLNARLQANGAKELGPFVLVTDAGPAPHLRLLASPAILPAGRPTAQLVSAPVVRVQIAPQRSSVPFFFACVALAVTFVAHARRRTATLEVA